VKWQNKRHKRNLKEQHQLLKTKTPAAATACKPKSAADKKQD
ncbi:hypothetical protein EVAR_73142_1, partial [Eumeta japonica]